MSRSCKECVHHNPDFIDKVCLHCSWPEFAGEPSNFEPKPQTNADRIRAMTGEELAEFIADDLIEPGYNTREKTVKMWLDWLKEE